MQQFNALALAVGAMSNLIFLPAAPPLLLKTLSKLAVYLSSCARNLAWSGKVVILMNSSLIYERKQKRDIYRRSKQVMKTLMLEEELFSELKKMTDTLDYKRKLGTWAPSFKTPMGCWIATSQSRALSSWMGSWYRTFWFMCYNLLSMFRDSIRL